MKRYLDQGEIEGWRTIVGGIREATRLISEKLECSRSKAEKLAAGRYPSLPTPTEQMALADLMHRPRDVLFPLVRARRKKQAS